MKRAKLVSLRSSPYLQETWKQNVSSNSFSHVVNEFQLRLPFAFIFPPANYCYHAVGCVPEWTGIYTFYQTVEQVPR